MKIRTAQEALTAYARYEGISEEDARQQVIAVLNRMIRDHDPILENIPSEGEYPTVEEFLKYTVRLYHREI